MGLDFDQLGFAAASCTTAARSLSGRCKRAIFFSAPALWHGLIITLFSSAALVVVGSQTDFKSAFVFSRDDPRVQGTLIAANPTNTEINDQVVQEFVYRYEVNAAQYEGRSFYPAKGVVEGVPVTVQYVADHPATSRLEGTRLAPLPMFVIFVVLPWTLIGLAMLYSVRRHYKKYADLMESGLVTTGKVVGIKESASDDDGPRLYDTSFEFVAADGVLHKGRSRTRGGNQVGGPARLVYCPARPENAELLAAMPKALRSMMGRGQ
jgi:hypothetical protein